MGFIAQGVTDNMRKMQAEMMAYVAQHSIDGLLTNLANDVCLSGTDRPLARMVGFLSDTAAERDE